jgi:hypothetical protein
MERFRGIGEKSRCWGQPARNIGLLWAVVQHKISNCSFFSIDMACGCQIYAPNLNFRIPLRIQYFSQLLCELFLRLGGGQGVFVFSFFIIFFISF